jgi:hypothetical protein
MTGYTKVFSSIVTSTIWRESPEVCKVWITMLALANQDGVVEASVPGLADMARVGLAEVENALATFQSPDAYSRSPEYEGRRIEPVEGGWRILNHSKYRFKLSPDDRRERDRLRKQRWREHQRSGCPTETGTKRDNRDSSRMSRHTEADADAKAEADKKQEYCAEPDGSTPASAVITLPLNDNSEYPIVQQQVNEWSGLFPAVHVGQQLRNMRAWLLANPTRRKTNRGIERFIVSWLSREQNNPNFHRSMSDGPENKQRPRTQRNRAALEAVKDRNSERLG